VSDAGYSQAPGLKARLKAGRAVVGCLLPYDAPWLVEVLGIAGYEFVVFDLEHEPLDMQSVAGLIRAADGVALPSIARMPCDDRVLPLLTAGIRGIEVPNLRNRRHAEQIVEMTRFPPRGRRTYYTQTRGARYGIGIDEGRWRQETDEQLLVIGMIEDIATVERLDEILTVDGIDAFHVGPLDLAQSMGNPPRAQLEAVITEVVTRCVAAGRPTAVGVATPWGIGGVETWTQRGAQIVIVASAWLLTHAVAGFLGEVRTRVAPGMAEWPPIPPLAGNRYFSDAR
jgi:2-keto-3-deoxy-L-rhamnonate aldolase RhmA